MTNLTDLREVEIATMDLIKIARLVESKIGVGHLSADIRDCAKRLNEYADTKYGNR